MNNLQYSDRKTKNLKYNILNPVIVELKKPGCISLKEKLRIVEDEQVQFTGIGTWLLGFGLFLGGVAYVNDENDAPIMAMVFGLVGMTQHF